MCNHTCWKWTSCAKLEHQVINNIMFSVVETKLGLFFCFVCLLPHEWFIYFLHFLFSLFLRVLEWSYKRWLWFYRKLENSFVKASQKADCQLNLLWLCKLKMVQQKVLLFCGCNKDLFHILANNSLDIWEVFKMYSTNPIRCLPHETWAFL